MPAQVTTHAEGKALALSEGIGTHASQSGCHRLPGLHTVETRTNKDCASCSPTSMSDTDSLAGNVCLYLTGMNSAAPVLLSTLTIRALGIVYTPGVGTKANQITQCSPSSFT